jgi:hypothetical protein
MDETSGTRMDETSNNNDLTANGTGGVGSATGALGNAADFESGDSDYLTIADASQTGLDGNASMSFSFWVNLETAVSGSPFTFFEKIGASAGYYCQAYTSGSSKIWFTWNDGGGSNQASAAASLGTGAWHHIVVTYNYATGSGSGIKIYLDGSALTMTDVSGSRTGGTSNSDSFDVGRNSTVQYYDGLMDEFSVWNGRVLTSGEVTTLYNSGTPLPYTESGGGGALSTLMLMGMGA